MPGILNLPRTTTLTWRIIHDPPGMGASNMALDHALARCLGPDEAVLRCYAWSRPTVSFGRNEPTRGRCSPEVARRLGVDLVRRPTGGRAVLHDGELTYSVVAPARALGGARSAYRAINEALAAALASLGAPVALAGASATLGLDAGPCFHAPAEGEVVGGGRKLVGSAQARVEGALLQHGSILLRGDQSALDELMGPAGDAAPAAMSYPSGAAALRDSSGAAALHDSSGAAALHDLIGPVDAADVAGAVVERMCSSFGGCWTEGGYRERERAEALSLEAERYATDGWTWRR